MKTAVETPTITPRKQCTVDGCTKPQIARRLCNGHYTRFMVHGETFPNWKIGDKSGNRNPMWKGGEIRLPDGRVALYRPDHPFPNVSKLYVLRYRLVMEEQLGRYILPTELVHHKNGINDDDRPENLEVTNRSDHAKGHYLDRVTNSKGQFLPGKHEYCH